MRPEDCEMIGGAMVAGLLLLCLIAGCATDRCVDWRRPNRMYDPMRGAPKVQEVTP